MPWKSKSKFFYQCEKFKLATIIVLCVVSAALFQLDTRYRVTESGILPKLDLQELGNHWFGTGSSIRFAPGPPATIILRNDDRRQTLISRIIENPKRYANIRVEVDIKIDEIRPGSAWWERAVVLLRSWDHKQTRMKYWPSEIAQISGTRPWQHYEAVIPVAENVSHMRLFIVHGGKSGVLQFRNLEVDAAADAPWFAAAKPVLIAAWIIAGAWIVVPLALTRYRDLFACLALTVFAATLAGTLTPQPLLSDTSGPALDRLAKIATPKPSIRQGSGGKAKTADDEKPQSDRTAPTPASPTFDTSPHGSILPVTFLKGSGDYVAHFLSHALLALFVFLAFRDVPWWRLLFYLLLTAATDELLQFFVITRSAGILDGLANAAGISVGFAIYMIWHTTRRRVPA